MFGLFTHHVLNYSFLHFLQISLEVQGLVVSLVVLFYLIKVASSEVKLYHLIQ